MFCPEILTQLSHSLLGLFAFNLSTDDLSPNGLARVQLQACLIFRLELFIRGSAHEQKRFYFTYNMSHIHVQLAWRC